MPIDRFSEGFEALIRSDQRQDTPSVPKAKAPKQVSVGVDPIAKQALKERMEMDLAFLAAELVNDLESSSDESDLVDAGDAEDLYAMVNAAKSDDIDGPSSKPKQKKGSPSDAASVLPALEPSLTVAPVAVAKTPAMQKPSGSNPSSSNGSVAIAPKIPGPKPATAKAAHDWTKS